MNKNYLQALSKILNENSISNNKENNLSKSDFKVIDELLNENLHYMNLLVNKPLYQVEFGNLFSVSMSILNNLNQLNKKEILLKEKL